MIDLGDVGRHSDGGVLAHSNFGQALEDNSLSFPAPCPLPGTTQLAPYVIVDIKVIMCRQSSFFLCVCVCMCAYHYIGGGCSGDL